MGGRRLMINGYFESEYRFEYRVLSLTLRYLTKPATLTLTRT